MPRKTIATAITAAALLGLVLLPAGAIADYYIPPGNSAVNQYTESFPGAGGETGGDEKKEATPAKTLGAGNAKQLEQKGQAGKEAAEVAAETAPPADLYAPEPAGKATKAGGGRDKQESGGNGGGNAGGGQGGSGPGGTQVSQPSGSSGLGSVLGEATGTAAGGNIGLWLPLAILATLAGTIVYRLRLRHHHPGPTA
ncbi:MAG: hypothetical protein AB7T48_14310 [Solirubrobacterales bacterium]